MDDDVDEQQHHRNAARKRRGAAEQQLQLDDADALALRGLLAVLLLLTQLAVAAAPADRYFGKLNMSTLRIRYEIMQLKKRYETHQLLPDQTLHLLLLTDDAFNQWARTYPHDPWLPSTGYAMAKLYEELPGTQARDRAVALLIYVKSRFPETSYARESRDQLHRGVAAKLQPAWAVAPSTTPSTAPLAPAAAPSAMPSATMPSASATP